MDVFMNVQCCNSHNRILIVGEGNFSFAMEFAKTVIDKELNVKVHATSFDSQETVFRDKFARSNVEFLLAQNHVTVSHCVDATRIHENFPELTFSAIIFNFPHVGGKSNIKKCRKLLADFFVSAGRYFCVDGRVFVSLCIGQGGTPADVSRGSYGNSWQVVSQAAKAGLYLKEIEPFKFDMMKTYKQAGYRGEIGRGFHTKGGLTHVFCKGELFQNEPCANVEHWLGSFDTVTATKIARTDEKYFDYVRQQRQQSLSLTDALEEILFHQMSCFGVNHGITYHSLEHEEFVDNVYNAISQSCCTSPHFAIGLGVVDISCAITPYSQPLSRHVVYNMTTDVLCDERKFSLDDVIAYVRGTIFREFKCNLITCSCAVEIVQCACICGDNKLCQKLPLKTHEVAYDVDNVPYFISDIPTAFWTSFEPECTISSDVLGEVTYNIIPCSKYELDDREEKYFDVSHNNDNNSRVKMIIRGSCVATVYMDKVVPSTVVVVFHVSQILMSCYNITDSRYLYTDDVLFKRSLMKCLLAANKEKCIRNNSSETFTTNTKYPLCHRHDLCFWLDEKHTEKHLFAAIRLITRDYVHSVRLIKVLKHTETNLISYCYRMIYGRPDGPFHHEHSVQLQNELRLYLLKLNFQLR